MTGAFLGRSVEESDAPIRLFCFAHAGGGSGFFQQWRTALRPDIEVCPVILPGRETRVRETAITRIDDLLDPLCAALAPYTDRTYALLGHSMGAVLAYEVARRLGDGPGAGPVCLFASGRRPPHLPARHLPLHTLPEPEFLDAVVKLNGTPDEVLGQPDLLRMLLPTLRADFALNETYAPRPGPGLACPVSALTGDADPEVELDEMASWRDTTTGAFTLRVFRGDHFYLKGRPDEVLAAIRADLRRLCPVPFGGLAELRP